MADQIRIIFEFKRSNPTMGVKKVIENLKAQIPSINAKMVRGVEIPATEVPTETAINPDDVQAEPRPSRAQRRSKPASRLDNWTPPSSSGSKSRVPPNLTNDLLDRPKSAELEALLEVYTKAHSEGRPFKGLYPLNVRGKMEYELSEMLWVDVPRGDSTEATIFERMKIESMLGHREAVWMLWKMLKTARTNTEDGEVMVTDDDIAKQLAAEYGTNPLDVDVDMEAGESGASMRLAKLLMSMTQ